MSYSSEVLADAPLAYYRLGEASGTSMVDASGNGRNGAYGASITLGTSGLLTGDSDKAVTFNGSGGVVPFGSWMSVDYMTAEAIIKPSSLTGAQEIICHDQVGSPGELAWRIRLNGSKVSYLHQNASGLFLSDGAATLTMGGTYHVAMTFDGANLVGYVNGAVDFTTARTGVTIKPSTPVTVGVLGNGFSEPFHGVIDEAAFYGYALSASRIAAHYAAATTTPVTKHYIGWGLPISSGA